MIRWERLEEYLYDYDLHGKSFTAHQYGVDHGLATTEATRDIQSYLNAQRAEKASTLFVLKRVSGTRTRSAQWSVGARTKDIRAISKALVDDVHTRVRRAVMPDIRRIAVLNPRAARRAEQQIDAIVNGALVVLANVVDDE